MFWRLSKVDPGRNAFVRAASVWGKALVGALPCRDGVPYIASTVSRERSLETILGSARLSSPTDDLNLIPIKFLAPRFSAVTAVCGPWFDQSNHPL